MMGHGLFSEKAHAEGVCSKSFLLLVIMTFSTSTFADTSQDAAVAKADASMGSSLNHFSVNTNSIPEARNATQYNNDVIVLQPQNRPKPAKNPQNSAP